MTILLLGYVQEQWPTVPQFCKTTAVDPEEHWGVR